eukprot:GAHX01000965.1.p1 GENE.GAHX01000965.1~~GAHX01000965.1.p1  ORF type:complete len:301 (+),score=32.64 GAHX01000965.1:35-937(+)
MPKHDNFPNVPVRFSTFLFALLIMPTARFFGSETGADQSFAFLFTDDITEQFTKKTEHYVIYAQASTHTNNPIKMDVSASGFINFQFDNVEIGIIQFKTGGNKLSSKRLREITFTTNTRLKAALQIQKEAGSFKTIGTFKQSFVTQTKRDPSVHNKLMLYTVLHVDTTGFGLDGVKSFDLTIHEYEYKVENKWFFKKVQMDLFLTNGSTISYSSIGQDFPLVNQVRVFIEAETNVTSSKLSATQDTTQSTTGKVNKKMPVNLAAIVLGVIACIFGVVIVILGYLLLVRRPRTNQRRILKK